MTTPIDPSTLDPAAGYQAIINFYLAQWGLSSLSSLVSQLGMSGAGNDQISLAIQQSPEYQARFVGNAERVAKGLSVLSPAQYIALEGQYRQILAALPDGFYDSKESMDNFIGGDVSPAELSQRVQDANTAYITAPQENRDAWNQYYGASGPGGAIASILDSSVAEPIIQQQVTAAGIGGAALSQGLQLTNKNTASQAAAQGVTIASARQAYAGIASRLNTDQSVASRFGTTFGQADEESANLLGNAQSANQQASLYSMEAAQFGGKGGADPTNGNAGNPGSND